MASPRRAAAAAYPRVSERAESESGVGFDFILVVSAGGSVVVVGGSCMCSSHLYST
jgi:hypothetical protein